MAFPTAGRAAGVSASEGAARAVGGAGAAGMGSRFLGGGAVLGGGTLGAAALGDDPEGVPLSGDALLVGGESEWGERSGRAAFLFSGDPLSFCSRSSALGVRPRELEESGEGGAGA